MIERIHKRMVTTPVLNQIAVCASACALLGLVGRQSAAANPTSSVSFRNASAYSLLTVNSYQGKGRRSGGSRKQSGGKKLADQKRLDNALLEAIVLNQADRAYDLLSRGANPNARDKSGRTPLLLVLGGSNTKTVSLLPTDEAADMVTTLLYQGAKVDLKDNKGNTPLLLAIRTRSTRSIDLILARNPPVNTPGEEGYTPLMVASALSDVDLCRKLVGRGANVNAVSEKGHTPLSICVVSPGDPILLPLMKKDGRKTEVLKLLVSKGANIRYKHDGYTLLMLAAGFGDPDTVSFLLDKGVDVNELGAEGITALAYAVVRGKFKAVKLLLAKGADVNLATDNGETVLMLAADRAHYTIIEQLIRAGARVNAKSLDGSTALIYAQRKNHTATVNQLLAAGAGHEEPVSTEKTTLRFHFKVKDTVRHRLSVAVTIAGREVIGKSGSRSEVKEIKPNGDAVIYTAYDPMIFLLDGKEVQQAAVTDSTMVRNKLGKIISIDSADKGKRSNAFSKVSQMISDAIFPENPVSQNESWTTEYDNPVVPGNKIKLTGTYLGTEKMDGADVWKIRQVCTALLNAEKESMSMDLIYWVRVDNGLYARSHGVLQGVPSANGPMTMTISMQAVK